MRRRCRRQLASAASRSFGAITIVPTFSVPRIATALLTDEQWEMIRLQEKQLGLRE